MAVVVQIIQQRCNCFLVSCWPLSGYRYNVVRIVLAGGWIGDDFLDVAVFSHQFQQFIVLICAAIAQEFEDIDNRLYLNLANLLRVFDAYFS